MYRSAMYRSIGVDAAVIEVLQSFEADNPMVLIYEPHSTPQNNRSVVVDGARH
jgi:hypothetical protein